MKTAEKWVIEEAGPPEDNGSSIHGGQFDMLTTYPCLIKWIKRVQLEAWQQGVKDSKECLLKRAFTEVSVQDLHDMLQSRQSI